MNAQSATAGLAPARPGQAAAALPDQYLTFVLGSEVFALGILAVKEIIEYSSVTEVPLMPPFLRGVINLRGSVVPVIDLAVRFGRIPAAITRRTCIVIVEHQAAGERRDIGLIVDSVNAVLEFPVGDIAPAPAFGANIRTDFIHGMARIDGKFVIMLDIDQVLALEDIERFVEACE